MEKLPEELKTEILVRLPVKSLHQLKCSSKSWFSFISNPNFAQLHFQRTSQQKQLIHRFLFCTTSSSVFRSIDIFNHTSFHDDSASVKLHFPLHHQPHTHFEILGSCRGLLLLSLTTKERILFLWNPSTGFCKQIPDPRRSSSKSIVRHSFCYDESNGDYLLLLSLYNYFHSLTGFEVLSLRTNSSAKVIKLPPNDDLMTSLSLPSCSVLNGVFYLLLSNRKPQREANILALNTRTKNFRQLPMPSDDIYLSRSCNLGVLEGCLTLIDSKDFNEVKVWVMRKQHGGEEPSWSCWTKLMSVSKSIYVSRRNWEFIDYYFSPLCFNKNGELVAKDGDLGLSKWNHKEDQLLEYRRYFDPCDRGISTSLYAETLLSFP